MCRIISYLGKPLLAADLLYKTDNSFITQTYNPKNMSSMLNLAGFGLAAWDKISPLPDKPFLYKTLSLPFYDCNLKMLANKIAPTCLLAHVRGVEIKERHIISEQNVHPFLFPNSTIAFAHNGNLVRFDIIKYEILKYIDDQFKINIQGNTDSEHMYALFLTRLNKCKVINSFKSINLALNETLDILKSIRKKFHIKEVSPLNFVISNGKFIAATRFVFDYGHYRNDSNLSPKMLYQSLWYTYGKSYGLYRGSYHMYPGNIKKSIIIASEPLTTDTTTWIEVPEYSLIAAYLVDGKITIKSAEIDLY